MWHPGRKRAAGQTAVAEADPPDNDEAAELLARIEGLVEANRGERDPELARQVLSLRHQAGIKILEGAHGDPIHVEPDFEALPDGEGLPEINAADVTPELLRAGVLRDGCLLVRGLIDRERASRFAGKIDDAFEERAGGAGRTTGLYEEFSPDLSRYHDLSAMRPWIEQGGGVLAVDSPTLNFEMLSMFEAAGVQQIVNTYLGEPALISINKTTLRRAEPSVSGAWHQDGSFMGPVRSLNLWLSLSRCGDEAPGLDLVPRRLAEYVPTGTDDAAYPKMVSRQKAEQAAGDKPILRPIFEPGDALFFDELFLHKTASDPSMRKPRFAIENWFFGASSFPADYAPLAA